MHVFTRDDIVKIRVQLEPTRESIALDVKRIRLYFFYDIDVALVALEVACKDISLPDAVELMDRFGRPYPPAWEAAMPDSLVSKLGGKLQGAHTPYAVEFMAADGEILATSDYQDQRKYLELVRGERQTPLAAH